MREPLEEEEWSLIEEAWRDPSDDDCAWACETAYRRLTGWELVETSRCELEVEVSGDTADPETDAAVICSGTGVEHLCP